MFGEYVPVRATIADVPHVQAHADSGQIIRWLHRAPAPHTTHMFHGEPEPAAALRDRIDRQLGWTAVVPRSREHVLVRCAQTRRPRPAIDRVPPPLRGSSQYGRGRPDGVRSS
ncbi:MBL fold metallo-hydrolase RNA specificity domain-containing protein [Streptomyces sp. NPDC057611]|uniref:MBL fold metallo-hydrolase RNA specificity domain-containing protein n=1 Tax=Streptomyces sp. NPDC057611 TaxID=3346182 RepID=UPI0036843338